MFYLYAIENTINGRMYIGKASEPNAAMVGDKNTGKLYKGRTWTLINGKRVWADKGDLS